MKTEIPLLAVAIAATVYLCSVVTVLLYIMNSLATSMQETRWVIEEVESLF